MASQKTTSDKNKKLKPFNNYLKYSGLAIQMLVTIGVMGFLGYKIDGWLELKFPVFLLLFIISALTGIIYRLIKSLDKDNEEG